jgi:dCMP deaminase
MRTILRPRAAALAVCAAPRYAPGHMADWDARFLQLARHIAQWSKDPSTQVGCVVVGPDREIRSTGFNGFPRGIADREDRLQDRDQKYPLVCHAEENAIMHAARIGVSLKGCSAYVTWPPCTRCARSLIQAGIGEIVYPAGLEIPERWLVDFRTSRDMLDEAGLRVRTVQVA